MRFKAVLLSVPLLLINSLSAYTWNELKDAVKANSSKITSLQSRVALLLTTPVGSTRSAFRLFYKGPGNIKMVNEQNPEFFYLKTNDTLIVKGNPSQPVQDALMGSVQADQSGLLFNFLSMVMDVESADLKSCGDDLCASVVKGISKEASDSLKIKTARLDVVASKTGLQIKSLTLNSGMSVNTIDIEYQVIDGISLPTRISSNTGGVVITQEFSEPVLNAGISNSVFKP